MMAGDHLEHMGHGGAGASQGMHGMAMYFHLGYEQYVLFQQWSAETSTSLLLTCLFYFVLAILYEILKAYRRVVALRSQINQTARIVRSGSVGANQQPSAGPKIAITCGGDSSAGSSLHSAASSHNGHQKLVHSSAHGTYIVDPSAPVPDDPTTGVPPSSTAVQQPMAGGCHPSYGVSEQANSTVIIGNDGGDPSAAVIPIFSTTREMFSVGHFTSTLLYMLQVLFAYLLMLAFMLFNVWICLAIIFGAAAGHFLLAQKAIALQDSANEDYCH